MKTNLKIGDLVTSYRKGFFRVTKIIRRWNDINPKNILISHREDDPNFDNSLCGKEINPLIYMKREFSLEGTISKSKREYYCDSSFCIKVKDYIPDLILKLEKQIKNLNEILDKEQ